MAEQDHTAEGTLTVDFDGVAAIFRDLQPAVAGVATVPEFVRKIQSATHPIFLKYFEFPQSRSYKPEELGLLVQHVIDCINNITPPQIPYESISVDGKWMLRPKKEDGSDDRKPS